MVRKQRKIDEPVVNSRLVKKRFDFNSYDVTVAACNQNNRRGIVGIGVVGCFKVGKNG